jgi:hypothetical protein
MSRLIHELFISPIKALHSDEFEPQGPIVQGAQECSGAIDRKLIGGRGLWITVVRVF